VTVAALKSRIMDWRDLTPTLHLSVYSQSVRGRISGECCHKDSHHRHSPRRRVPACPFVSTFCQPSSDVAIVVVVGSVCLRCCLFLQSCGQIPSNPIRVLVSNAMTNRKLDFLRELVSNMMRQGPPAKRLEGAEANRWAAEFAYFHRWAVRRACRHRARRRRRRHRLARVFAKAETRYQRGVHPRTLIKANLDSSIQSFC
jgi:hypothetical protein